jgi:hypothetical protein
MAARGTTEKELIKNKILEVFEGSFVNDKEIRIPINDVQIKVSLTCAKDIVSADGGSTSGKGDTVTPQATVSAPTEEEVAQVKSMIEKLGL